MIPLIVGTALALAALSFVLYPLLSGKTGKLSDSEYAALKASHTQREIDAMRSSGGVVCESCGPRPEPDARFCSNCGARLAAWRPDSRPGSV